MKNIDKLKEDIMLMDSKQLADLLNFHSCRDCVAHGLCFISDEEPCESVMQRWLEQGVETKDR